MSDLSSTAGYAPQRGRVGAYPVILISLLFIAASVRLALPAIHGGVFDALSTDDAMRLVEVRDLIGGQGWFDLFQYRLDPPGMLMHWSRVIDAPLAGLILVLRPLLGTHGAETVTLYFWPALLFAVALALVAAIARQLTTNISAQIAAAVLAVLALPALVHFRAGAIDHHNAQIDLLLALVLMTAQLERSAVKAALGGLFVSLSLAIGLEMLPALAAVGVAVFGLLVWRGAPVARQVGAFGAGLAGSSLLLAPALIPISSLGAQVCDAFGGPVLLLAIGGGVSLMVMVAIDRYRPTLRMRIVSGAVLAIVLVGAFLLLYSGCIASPFAHLDPIVVQLWVNNVAEAISFTRMLHLFPENIPAYYGLPILTLVVGLMALRRSPPPETFRWIVGIVTLAALIGTSVWEMRGAAGASMVAAPLFAASSRCAMADACFCAKPVCLVGPCVARQPFRHGALCQADARRDRQATGYSCCAIVPEHVGCGFPEPTSEGTRDGAGRSRTGDPCRNGGRGFCRPLPSQQRRQLRPAQADDGALAHGAEGIVGPQSRLRGDLRNNARSEHHQARSGWTGGAARPWRGA